MKTFHHWTIVAAVAALVGMMGAAATSARASNFARYQPPVKSAGPSSKVGPNLAELRRQVYKASLSMDGCR